MNYQLITEAPSWLILFCFAAGFLYSFLLYRKEKAFAESSLWVTRILALFRFLSVSVLCILLLSPLIRTIFREVEKPIVLILQDQSASVLTIKDSSLFVKNYPEEINSLKRSLEEDFDVRLFSIGDKITEGINFDFKARETDLSGPVGEMRARFSGRNLGAVVLASDGLYNKGSNPLYAFPELKVPVFTIGLGDTAVRKDVLISKVNHNKTAFIGNTFPVELTLDARQCSGKEITLNISKNNKEIFTKSIKVGSDRFNMVLPVFLEANEKGMNHFIATVTKVDNEINYSNNSRDFFIDVTDNKQQILLLANAPHPDLAALRDIIETNPNIQLKIVMFDDFDGTIGNTNLFILHQIPSSTKPANSLFEKLQKQNIPVLFILGSQTNVTTFNNLDAGIKISENRGNLNEVQADPQKEFSLFTMEEENLRMLSDFPPLISPFGNYDTKGKVYSLLTQKIGKVKTGMPLLSFSVEGDFKTAVLAGEGLWKWKLREFADHGNSNAVTATLTKTIQYLATREKMTPFRLFYKNTYFENEPLLIDAEFYNESGELVNLSDVKISVTDENDKSFQFVFSKTEKAYTLNAGYLPVGSYKFSASTSNNANTFTESGSFTINALQAEFTETIANHQLLNAISDRTGGKFYHNGKVAEIAKDIKNRNDIKAVSYTQKKLDDVINLKWIFLLIILLLSAEWFLRKRSGAY
ncbi:MAG: hypothetical protein IPP71_14670 [Bacteroidetes bacterium]|nr:hypothetical protein [Bacteroidota bacterium]